MPDQTPVTYDAQTRRRSERRVEIQPSAPPRRPASVYEWTAMLAVAVVAIVADQVTKMIAIANLTLDEEVSVVPGFGLHYHRNTGVAFSQLAGRSELVIALTVAALIWIAIYFRRSGGSHPLLPPAIGMLAGGAASNLVDRLGDGTVTDFLHISHWPIFNLADTMIVIGVGVLLLALSLNERRRPDAS